MDGIRMLGWGFVVLALLALAVAGFYGVNWWIATTPGTAKNIQIREGCEAWHNLENLRHFNVRAERGDFRLRANLLYSKSEIDERCEEWAKTDPWDARRVKQAAGAASALCLLGVLLLAIRRPAQVLLVKAKKEGQQVGR